MLRNHLIKLYVLLIVIGCLIGCVHPQPAVQGSMNADAQKKAETSAPADPFNSLTDPSEKSHPEDTLPFDGIVNKEISVSEIEQSQNVRKMAGQGVGWQHRRPHSKAHKPTYSLLSPESVNQTESTGTADVVFNFDNADLYEVVRTMSDLLGINYIVDPGVQGKVTIHTAGKLRKSDLFDVFFQILEANGLTAVKEGHLYKIGRLKDAPHMPLISRVGRDADKTPYGERVIMQIIPLDYITAQEMTKLLTPFMSPEGTIITHEGSNSLLLIDRDINIIKALELVRVFDIDIFEKVQYRFYALDYVDADEMVPLLQNIFSAYGKKETDQLKIIPIKRLNLLLVLSSDPDDFNKAERFITQLDVPSDGVEPRIYVYFVKNGNAEELGSLLSSVFGDTSSEVQNRPAQKGEDDQEKKEFQPTNPFANTVKGKKNAAKVGGKVGDGAGQSEGAATLKGEIKITTDETRNALIIQATPPDYTIIENILRQIDVLPRQVLIEVVIAEISLDGNADIGVEWSYEKGSGGTLSTSLLSAQMGSSGLQYILGQTDRWSAAFSALASENKLNILSAPVVLASDNKEANINVSDQIPVASAEYIYSDSGASGVTQTNIQYRDTGIILSVTPHINDRGLVSMEVSQEVSEQGDGVSVGGKDYPSFRDRSVATTLTVKDGQTIVMGGLMREKESKGNSGVPFLSKIPFVGFLFGKDSKEYTKTELILLITPRVVVNLEDVDEVTEDFKLKVEGIKKQRKDDKRTLIDYLDY